MGTYSPSNMLTAEYGSSVPSLQLPRSTDPVAVMRYIASQTTRYLGIIGDSNSANAFNGIYETQAGGYVAWLEPLSYGRLRPISCYATGGQEILPDAGQVNGMDVQLAALRADVNYPIITDVLSMFGTNDSDTDPDTVAAAYINKLKDLQGKRVWVLTIPPVGSTMVDGNTFDATTPRWAWIVHFNNSLKHYASRSGANINVIDINPIIANATDVKGTAASGTMTTDDLHTTHSAACSIATVVVAAMTADMPAQYDMVTSAADYSGNAGISSSLYKPTNIHPDPLFSGTASWTASVSGGVINGALSTNANDETGFGNFMKVQADASAGALDNIIRATGTSSVARVLTGRWIYAEGLIRVPAGHKFHTVRTSIGLNINGVAYNPYCLAPGTMSGQKSVFSTGKKVFLARTPPVWVPPGASVTTCTPTITGFMNGVGSATEYFEVAQFAIRQPVTLLTQAP